MLISFKSRPMSRSLGAAGGLGVLLERVANWGAIACDVVKFGDGGEDCTGCKFKS